MGDNLCVTKLGDRALNQEASDVLFHTFETSSLRSPQSFNVKGDTGFLKLKYPVKKVLWLQTGFHATMFILVSVEKLPHEMFVVDGLRSPINSVLNVHHPPGHGSKCGSC